MSLHAFAMALREVFAGNRNFSPGFQGLVTAAVTQVFGTAGQDGLTTIHCGNAAVMIGIDDGFDDVWAEGDLDVFADDLQAVARLITAGYPALADRT